MKLKKILQMKLKNLSKYLFSLTLLLILTNVSQSEDQVDIWNKKK